MITGISEGIQNNLLKIKETNLVVRAITAVSEVMNSDITALLTYDVWGVVHNCVGEIVQNDVLKIEETNGVPWVVASALEELSFDVHVTTLVVFLCNIKSTIISCIRLWSKININGTTIVVEELLEADVHHGVVTGHLASSHFDLVLSTIVGRKTLTDIDLAVGGIGIEITGPDNSGALIVVEAGYEIDKHVLIVVNDFKWLLKTDKNCIKSI